MVEAIRRWNFFLEEIEMPVSASDGKCGALSCVGIVLRRSLHRLQNDSCLTASAVSDSDEDEKSVSTRGSGSEYSSVLRRNSISERIVNSTLDLANRAIELRGKIRAKLPRTSLTDLVIGRSSPVSSPSRLAQRQPLEVGRHLIKSGYLIELSPDGKRKRRHLFLFTDFVACSKFTKLAELTGRQMVVKWYQHLSRVTIKLDSILPESITSSTVNTASLLSQATELRNRIARSPSDQLRKKLATIENKLLIESADLCLTLIVQTHSNRNAQIKTDTYTFLLVSELERTMWIAAFRTLQNNIDCRFAPKLQRNVVDAHIRSCRLEPFSRWSNSNDDVVCPKGELAVKVHSLMGLKKSMDAYAVIEWDTHGHYLHKCRTKNADGIEPCWEEEFTLQLDGARGLRALLYEQSEHQPPVYRGGAELKITEQWLRSLNRYITYVPLTQPSFVSDAAHEPRELQFCLSFNFTAEIAVPDDLSGSASASIFNIPFEDVCRREGVQVPSIISRCVEEVERRGMDEVGIYRLSGSITDLNRLRQKFDAKPASCVLHEVDINCITGLLKSFLRQLPVSLFTDKLYEDFVGAFYSLGSGTIEASIEADIATNNGVRKMVTLFSDLPKVNQSTLVYLFEHLIRVSRQEAQNKMSLHNLATVFGPTMMRPALLSSSHTDLQNLVSNGTLDVMAQSGIVYFFLARMKLGLPIQLSE